MADTRQLDYEHALIESFDPLAGLRGRLRDLSADKAEWAGIPIPLEGLPLTVEANYPFAEVYNRQDDDAVPEDVKLRNVFWSRRLRTTIVVWEEGGKVCWGPAGRSHGVDHMLHTMGASDAWGIGQEQKALQLLGTMIRHRMFKRYLLTGMFLETSKRSGISYVFRKLRPTIALSTKGAETKILAALCLHPIGYYEESWAGAMCPTDDVIAHLALMRGDEVMLWRRSNQHPADRPEAGL